MNFSRYILVSLGLFGVAACGRGSSSFTPPSEQGGSNPDASSSPDLERPDLESTTQPDEKAQVDARLAAAEQDPDENTEGEVVLANADGVSVGNGGDGIECIDENGIETVELLDYFEAESQWSLPTGLGELKTKDPIERAAQVLERLKAFDPSRANDLLRRLEDFKRNAVYLPGMDLENISDSKHVGTKRGCKLVQLARQVAKPSIYEKKYTIDADRFEKLSLDHKAGLILHEIIYNRFLSNGLIDVEAPNSRPVRYYNALVSTAGMEAAAGFKKSYYEQLSLMGMPIRLSSFCFGKPKLAENGQVQAILLDLSPCSLDRFDPGLKLDFAAENLLDWSEHTVSAFSTKIFPIEKRGPRSVRLWNTRRFKGARVVFIHDATKAGTEFGSIRWIDSSPVDLLASSTGDRIEGKAELSIIDGFYVTSLKRPLDQELIWKRDVLKASIDRMGFFPDGRIQFVQIAGNRYGSKRPIPMRVCPQESQTTIPLCPEGFAYFDQDACIIYADICPTEPLLVKEGLTVIPRSLVAVDRDGSIGLNADPAKDLSSGEAVHQDIYASRMLDDFLNPLWIDDPLMRSLSIEAMSRYELMKSRWFFLGRTAETSLMNFPEKSPWLRDGLIPPGEVFRVNHFFPNGRIEGHYVKDDESTKIE